MEVEVLQHDAPKNPGRFFRRRINMKPLLVMTLACAAAVSVLAQTQTETQRKFPTPSEMATHQVKRLTTLLSLTSAQQQQATTIFTNAATSEQTLHESEKQSRDSLRTAVKANDSATIDSVATSMAQTTAQLTSIRAKAEAAFYQILTADQQSKFTELESEHMGPLGGHDGPPPAMGFR
jgi:Spy/CpxP family protein refolding chaperone